MTKWRERLSNESGLTLVELLAGLFLFGLALSMLYGVLMSGYSLKDKVTRQATLNNYADLLVNEIMLSLKNADEVKQIPSEQFLASEGVFDALWTTQYENRGTKQQKRVYHLYLISRNILPASSDENGNPIYFYNLIREKYELPDGRTFLEFTDTIHGNPAGVSAVEAVQLNDDRFPLLESVIQEKQVKEDGTEEIIKKKVKAFSVQYDNDFDIQDTVSLTLTICRYFSEQPEQPASAPFTFQSQININ
jgi:hypothetical protein